MVHERLAAVRDRLRSVPARWRKAGLALVGLEVGTRLIAPNLVSRVLLDHFQRGGAGPLLRLYDWLVGGSLSRGAILALGIVPYLSARIYMRVVRALVPTIGAMHASGPGRARLARWTRVLTVGLALVQSYGFARFAQSIPGAVTHPGAGFIVQTMLVLTMGTICVMWLSEQIAAAIDGGAGVDATRARPISMRLAAAAFALVAATIAGSCATNRGGGTPPAPKSESKVSAASPGAPEMTGMSGHDMRAMGSHSAAESAFLFPDGNDKGWTKVENGSQHTMAPEIPLAKLPAETRLQLLHQLALTMDVVKKYPTVKDAEAAGYRRAGPFLPGLGTHYDGMKSDAPIAGFMYMSFATESSAKGPKGFAGPNDHWHYHTGICLTPGSNGALEALGFDGSITQAQCKAKGGNFVASTQDLLHVWTVPGYSNPLGVFGHANPALTCGDGTYYTDDHDITNSCRQP